MAQRKAIISNKQPAALQSNLGICKLPTEEIAKKPSKEMQDGLNLRLHNAAHSGNYSEIQKWLSMGAEIDSKGFHGRTALFFAVMAGKIQKCKLLLENGAKPDIQDDHKTTALMDAVDNRNIEICKLLLEYGADPHLKNSDGMSAFDLSRENDPSAELNMLFIMKPMMGKDFVAFVDAFKACAKQ